MPGPLSIPGLAPSVWPTTPRREDGGELVRLLDAAEAVDPRFALILWMAATTGRRLGAILKTQAAWLSELEADGKRVGVVAFPAAVEKAKRASRAALPPKALRITQELRRSPAVSSSPASCSPAGR